MLMISCFLTGKLNMFVRTLTILASMFCIFCSSKAIAHVFPEALEKFEYDKLSLQYIDVNSNGKSVMFLAKDNYFYVAVIGSHIGKTGVVKFIDAKKIIVSHLYLDSDGDWAERQLQWFIDKRPEEMPLKHDIKYELPDDKRRSNKKCN